MGNQEIITMWKILQHVDFSHSNPNTSLQPHSPVQLFKLNKI
jgi:hypothetical protein